MCVGFEPTPVPLSATHPHLQVLQLCLLHSPCITNTLHNQSATLAGVAHSLKLGTRRRTLTSDLNVRSIALYTTELYGQKLILTQFFYFVNHFVPMFSEPMSTRFFDMCTCCILIPIQHFVAGYHFIVFCNKQVY